MLYPLYKDATTIATEASGQDTKSCGLSYHRNLSLPFFCDESLKYVNVYIAPHD